MNHSSREERNVSIVIIAIVIALGLLGAVAITLVIIQHAEARECPVGTPAGNASKTRCVHP
jgi:hypothetical protein